MVADTDSSTDESCVVCGREVMLVALADGECMLECDCGRVLALLA